MALGNLYGGKTADRDNDPDRLYGRILMAAVWIAAIPVLGGLVNRASRPAAQSAGLFCARFF